MRLRQYLEKVRERWDQAKTATVNFIEALDALGTLVMIVLLGIYLTFTVLKILAPLITFAVFAAVTAWACTDRDRTNKMLAFGGIALYLLSWPMMATWGEWAAVGTLFLAMASYFGAIVRAPDAKRPTQTQAFA